jgi:hypothetical protein
MMDNDKVSESARIAAIEFVLLDVLVRQYLQFPDPVQAAADHRVHLKKIFSEPASIPGFDAAISALAVSAIADHVDRIVELAGQTASRRADERKLP